MKAIICGLILLALLICPVTAYIANSSSVITSYTDTRFLPSTYIPYEYELLLIGLGFTCWFLMKYFAELEVLFGLLAILVFGAAAWLSAYVSKNDVFTMLDPITNDTTILYTQLVTPQPILQVILVVCFLFAIIAEVYVLFLRAADKVTDEGLLGKQQR